MLSCKQEPWATTFSGNTEQLSIVVSDLKMLKPKSSLQIEILQMKMMQMQDTHTTTQNHEHWEYSEIQ